MTQKAVSDDHHCGNQRMKGLALTSRVSNACLTHTQCPLDRKAQVQQLRVFSLSKSLLFFAYTQTTQQVSLFSLQKEGDLPSFTLSDNSMT
ncbi:hypothetical protein A1OQ_15945 [Enterovibrio norvegicus FF-162]|uniref:Uncharacterized protein n=1 Tax=Enterovibrio norvegicus FF-454 TaxID=1185651 RepID=A0A1E5BYE0_9GAMM|nr:hypothetical protein A1OK_04125 [Enterovibrio norvegicus FF-454]OEE87069.1 hypothetical protein A1OQ_15945 [Enterovibrio norvegicus FF-162]